MRDKLFLLIVTSILFLSFVNADIYSDCTIYGNCKPAATSTTTSSVNYSIVNTNNSIYWNGYSWHNMSLPFANWLSSYTPSLVQGNPQEIAIFNSTGSVTGTGNFTFNTTTNQLTLNRNAQQPSAPTILGTALRINCGDNDQCRAAITTYGLAGIAAFSVRSARGTGALPTATQAGDLLGQFDAWGRSTTAFSLTPKAMLKFTASQDFNDTAQGTYASIWTTKKDTIVPAESIRIDDGQTTIFGNLTAQNITAQNIYANNLLNSSELSSSYVTYENATSNVNLGNYSLSTRELFINNNTEYMNITSEEIITGSKMMMLNGRGNYGAGYGQRGGLYIFSDNEAMGGVNASSIIFVQAFNPDGNQGGISQTELGDLDFYSASEVFHFGNYWTISSAGEFSTAYGKKITTTGNVKTGALNVIGSANVTGDFNVTKNIYTALKLGVGVNAKTTLDVLGTANISGITNINNTIIVRDSRVGIGTNVPATPLEVASTGAFRLSGSANQIQFGTSATRISSDNTNIFFRTANEDVMTINGTTNKVGIGTTNPASRTHISDNATNINSNGLLTLTDSADDNDKMGFSAVYNANNDVDLFLGHKWSSDTTFQKQITLKGATGNVGIKTTNPSATLDVNGTANFTGDVKPTNSSFSLGSSVLRWLKGWFVNLDVSGTANITTLNVSGNVHIDGNLSVKRPYGMFSSTEDQTLALADTAYPITFNWTEDTYEVYKQGTSNFSVGQSGDYLIELSAIFQSAVANKQSNIWVQIMNSSGSWNNVPRSNTATTIRTSGSDYVIAVPFILDINTNEKFRIMWGANDNGVFLNYMTNTSYSPETPSIILTISKISESTP